MIIYKFTIPHTEDEIKQIISLNTIPYKSGMIGYTDNKYIGYCNNNHIIIGKSPDGKSSYVTSFFCGVLRRKKHKYELCGVFTFPWKTLLPQFILLSIFIIILSVLNRNILFLLIAYFAYFFMIILGIIMNSFIHNKTKCEIIDFITNKLHGTLTR